MELDTLRDPQRVAQRARTLGMVPVANPAFLKLVRRLDPRQRRAGCGHRRAAPHAAADPAPGRAHAARGAGHARRPRRRRALGAVRALGTVEKKSRAGRTRPPASRATRHRRTQGWASPAAVEAPARRGRSSRPGSTSGTRAAGRSKAAAAATPTGTRQTGRDRALARVRTASLLRLRIGFLLIAMVVSVFAVRLFQLQGLDAATYAAQARAVGAVQEVLPATRGAITDRNGEPLAESLDGMMIVADPTKTEDDAAAIASVLEERLGIDYIEAVREPQLARRERPVPLHRATHPLHAGDRGRRRPHRARLQGPRHPARPAAQLPGQGRRRPTSSAGSTTRATAPTGPSCCSRSCWRARTARPPTTSAAATASRWATTAWSSRSNGTDVALTIDRDVQWYTQRVLRQTVEDVGAESGSAVVMDTQTGQLLSLADYPTFDPNSVTSAIDTRRLGSRALREVYEPGSVEKVLTMARAHRRRPRHPAHPAHGARASCSSSGRPINDHWDARHHRPHPDRRAGQVLQHRHGPGRAHHGRRRSCGAT